MWNNFIGRQVRRSNRNLLLANLLILAGIVLGTVLFWNYLSTFLGTPKNLTDAEIAALSYDKDAGRIVRISGTESFQSGYQYLENGRVKAEFAVLDVGDRLVLVKARPGLAPYQSAFVGSVESAPGGVIPDVTQQLRAMYPDRPVNFADYMLNAYDYQDDGWIGLAVGLPLLGLAIWNLFKWKKRSADMSAHPTVAALKVAGQPWQVAQAIEGELATAQDIGKLKLTQNWLFGEYFFGLHVRRLQDLAWVYMKVTKHYHGFIPTGKTYAVSLNTVDGGALEVNAKNEKQAQAMVAAIGQHAPFAMLGHSPELESAWTKNRDEFLAAVEQRRQQAPRAEAATAG